MTFESKLKVLYNRKVEIDALESERNTKRMVWMKAGKDVRRLSQEIILKYKELKDSI